MSEHSRWEDVKAHVARRKRYAAAIYDSDNPNSDLWTYAESDAQDQYHDYADAAMAVADAEHQVLLTNVREWREDALGWQKLAHKKIEENARLRATIERVRAVHADDGTGRCTACEIHGDDRPYIVGECPTTAAMDGDTNA